jgi:hypothetical protein
MIVARNPHSIEAAQPSPVDGELTPVKLKEAELAAEQRRLANFVDFVGEGRGSQTLAKALVETERRVETLSEEVGMLRRSREKVFTAPPIEWISEARQAEAVAGAPHSAVSAGASQSARDDPPRTRYA